MSSNSTEISPESNFKNKLKKIKLANNSYGYIDPTWKPSFHELEKGVNEAAESIEKTKANLLYSSQNNPALRLLLYETDSTNTKILRKWSELLFRLSIAQQIIQKCIQGQKINISYIKETYSNIPEYVIMHIIKAIQIMNSPNAIPTKRIIEILSLDPIRYERLDTWKMTKIEYIDTMLKGFLNCHLVISCSAYRQRMKEKVYVIIDQNDKYGIYRENIDKTGNIKNTIEHLGISMPTKPSEIKKIMDKMKILGPRQSMIWFINELMDTLMYDFDWQETAKYAVFVYNTLCRIK